MDFVPEIADMFSNEGSVMSEEKSGLEQLSPELRDLTEMEAAAMCRQMQRLSSTITRVMVEGATRLAIELVSDPERLKEYMDKFGLEKG